ncbi:MAG: DUF2784 domain-containing protein [Desulfobulbaceae bacterium]|nr:DUF2784 domain-containing protein [Desulfobulbaceae bacterium]HIJ78792.1 DUF2784 domain-containing protein [Deltaproteobacteria bacterium]
MSYPILADLVLVVHVTFVLFVVGGFLAVVLGGCFHWQWVKNFRFRLAHVVAILVVVLQSWLGHFCPLTTWEMQLRIKEGGPTYHDTFIAHWLHELFFFEASPWVFTVCYTLFGGAVLVGWFLVPPRRSRRKSPKSS